MGAEKEEYLMKLLKISDFVAQYGVSRSTVYRLFDSGSLTQVKIGRATRINSDEAENWLARLMLGQS